MIDFIDGDIWEAFEAGISVAHGVNCDGIMGGGIAVQFRERFPAMFEHYEHECLDWGTLLLGDVYFYDAGEGRFVINLFTQPSTRGASYDALMTALKKLRLEMQTRNIETVAMPKIGAGLGGLEWEVVKVMLISVFGGVREYSVIVYENYIPR